MLRSVSRPTFPQPMVSVIGPRRKGPWVARGQSLESGGRGRRIRSVFGRIGLLVFSGAREAEHPCRSSSFPA